MSARPSRNPRSWAGFRAWRRWRCRRIRRQLACVSAPVDPVGGGWGVSAGPAAPANGVGPSSWPGLRHYCGPASLRQLRWLRPQRRGREGRTGAIVEAVEVVAVLPGILVPGLDSGRGGGGGRRLAGSRLPPTLLRPGQPPAAAALAATSTAGKRGPYRDYRGGGGGRRLAADPSDTIAALASPRRQLRWLRPQQRAYCVL